MGSGSVRPGRYVIGVSGEEELRVSLPVVGGAGVKGKESGGCGWLLKKARRSTLKIMVGRVGYMNTRCEVTTMNPGVGNRY